MEEKRISRCIVHCEWGCCGCRKDNGVCVWYGEMMGIPLGWVIKDVDRVCSLQRELCTTIAAPL